MRDEEVEMLLRGAGPLRPRAGKETFAGRVRREAAWRGRGRADLRLVYGLAALAAANLVVGSMIEGRRAELMEVRRPAPVSATIPWAPPEVPRELQQPRPAPPAAGSPLLSAHPTPQETQR
jgi:hypothetical protein